MYCLKKKKTWNNALASKQKLGDAEMPDTKTQIKKKIMLCGYVRNIGSYDRIIWQNIHIIL